MLLEMAIFFTVGLTEGAVHEEGKQHMRLRHPGGVPAWVGSEKTE